MKFQKKMQEYIWGHKLQKRWCKLTAALAMIVIAATATALILPAVTMESTPKMLECQINLHTHTDNCYDEAGNFVCGYADFVVHTHVSSCYAEDGTLICPLPEIQPHVHSATCYQETHVPICGFQETMGHIHDDSCYQTTQDPSCGLDESDPHIHEGHVHTEDCYEISEILICKQTEEDHVHTEQCYEPQRILVCTQDTGCYDEEGKLVCTIPEEGHTHTDACYLKTLICGQEETSSHAHTDGCYEMRKEPVCGKEEIILHSHSDACFDENGKVICGMQEVKEHIHDGSCLPPQDVNSALPNQSTAESIDFSDMITKITLQVQENGSWVELVENSVEEGATLRVQIEFTIAGGNLSDENRAIYYKLPSAFSFYEQKQGDVSYNDGEPAGTYTIDNEGHVEIVFYDTLPIAQDFSGYFRFEGTVALPESEEGGSLDFGCDDGFISIVPEKEPNPSVGETDDFTIEAGGENNAEPLDGALFLLERFEKRTEEEYAWQKVSTTVTEDNNSSGAGSNGLFEKIILSTLKTGGSHWHDTIYKIQETRPSDDYQITSDSYHYFVWMREDATVQSTITTMQAAFEAAGITPDQVEFVPYNAIDSLKIENEPLTTSIQVVKQWENAMGETLKEELPTSIRFTLYQHLNGETTQYGEIVTIQADENGNWAYAWTSLPKRDENGGEYTYTVIESPVNGYETSYFYPIDGNAGTGISGGTITVINRKTSSYVLPATGGTGTTSFIIAGLLLTGAAGVGYKYLRRKRQKEGSFSEP